MKKITKTIQNIIQGKPDPLTREAIQLFNKHKFKQALLKFEEPWKETYGQEERFLRGLIQVAAAFHHFEENRLQSALALYHSSIHLLFNYVPKYQNIDVKNLLGGMKIAFADLIEEGPKSGVTLDKKLVPTIRIT